MNFSKNDYTNKYNFKSASTPKNTDIQKSDSNLNNKIKFSSNIKKSEMELIFFSNRQ